MRSSLESIELGVSRDARAGKGEEDPALWKKKRRATVLDLASV